MKNYRLNLFFTDAYVRLHFSIVVHTLCELLEKWLGAVLFQKTFEKVAGDVTNNSSIFQTSDGFWQFLFLSKLTFEQVILLNAFVTLVASVSGGYFVTQAHLLAEIQESKRRKQVIKAATSGAQVSSGADGNRSEQVALVLERVSLMYKFESSEKYDRAHQTYAFVIGIIFGFIFLWQVGALIIGIFASTILLQTFVYKNFLASIDKKVLKIKEKIHYRCLDIARCADVVATSNMDHEEEELVDQLTEKTSVLQHHRAQIDRVNTTVYLYLLSTTIPAGLALIFYTYDRLSEDPLDLLFSLFAMLTIVDQVHKAKLYLDSTEDSDRKYHIYLQFVESWLQVSQARDEDDEDENKIEVLLSQSDETHSNLIVKTDVSFSPEGEAWPLGDIQLNNLTILYNKALESVGEKKGNALDNVYPSENLASFDSLASENGINGSIVMKNRSFLFHHKECTALIGESGSGKSSILKVIAGLLLPHNGDIYFGSMRLTKQTRRTIRSNMSMCSQDSLLFARTVRENVWYGNQNSCDDDRIMQVLGVVGLSDWYSNLPLGLDYMLEAGEEQVSGGQAQRLQLARLLCKDNHYVLLDEALSALDSKNRKRILEYLKTYLKGKTTVWVTHNSDVMEFVDNVIDISNEE